MLKLSVTAIVLFASASAFAVPSWLICKGARNRVSIQTNPGSESVSLGSPSQSRDAEITKFERSRCPECYLIEAKIGAQALQILLRGERNDDGDLVVKGQLTTKGRAEALTCERITARRRF